MQSYAHLSKLDSQIGHEASMFSERLLWGKRIAATKPKADQQGPRQAFEAHRLPQPCRSLQSQQPVQL